MEEWKECKISDVIDEISMGPFGSNIKVDNFIDFGVPVLNGSNLQGFKLQEESFNYVSQEKADSLGKANAHRGDVVITHRGTLGQIVYIPQDSKFEQYVISQSQFRLKLKQDLILPDFFVYFFHTPIGQHRILMNASQVGVPALARPTTTFKEVFVPVPPLETQNAIMAILSSLDKKIEVNKRLNDNLQNQADALFKSFFVDFELFREGEFIETELGLIPKDWKILLFGDFIVALTEKAPVDSLPEYSVTNNGIIPRDTKFNKKLSKSSSMNKVLRKNNLVFGMSREILNWGIMEDEIGGVSSAYNIYKIDEDLVDPTYLRLYMKAKISEFNSLIGTAAREGQSLDKGQLMQRKIYVPTKDVLQDFFAHYVPIMESIHNAEQESSRLAQLRDALLPKLMSDELKIS